MAGEIEDIARRTSPQQAIRELLAKLRDEDLHHLRRRLRHVVAPEVIDDAIHGNDAVGVKEQQRQQGSLPASRQLDGTRVVYRLERPENPELHVSPATIICVVPRPVESGWPECCDGSRARNSAVAPYRPFTGRSTGALRPGVSRGRAIRGKRAGLRTQKEERRR